MKKDFWQRFVESGSVYDYLAYRNSLNNQITSGGENEQSDDKGDRNSNKGSQDKGK